MRRKPRSYDFPLGLSIVVLLLVLFASLASCQAPPASSGETPEPEEPGQAVSWTRPPEIERTGDAEAPSLIAGLDISRAQQVSVSLKDYRDGTSVVPDQLLIIGTLQDLDVLMGQPEFEDWIEIARFPEDSPDLQTRLLRLPPNSDLSAAQGVVTDAANRLRLGSVQSLPNYLHAAPWDIGAEPWDIGAEPWDIGAEEVDAGEIAATTCPLQEDNRTQAHAFPWQQWALLNDASGRQGIDLYAEVDGERLVGATGEGVHVIILDTAPFDEPGEYRITGLRDDDGSLQPLQVQFPGTVLTKETDTPSPDQESRNGNINEHGLFVAALINYVAPNASLELVRVLNDDGIGDMATLMKALEDIESRTDLSRTVINMSLSLRMQQTVADAFGTTPIEPQAAIPPVPEGSGDDADDLEALRVKLQALQEKGAVIIAAAGNDSSLTEPPTTPILGAFTADTPTSVYLANVVARWPEAIGVAGHDTDAIASCFSNQFKPGQIVEGQLGTQEEQGEVVPLTESLLVYAPAGDGSDRTDKEQAQSCENRLPLCERGCGAESYSCRHGLTSLTTRGYAYWAGTSFATPLVSGMVALVRQNSNGSAQEIQECVVSHFNQNGRDFDVQGLVSTCSAQAAATAD